MKIKEIMTKNPKIVNADAPIIEAVKLMQEKNCGCIPVEDNDKFVGMITDRDIVVRTLAHKQDPEKAKVKDAMTSKKLYCYEDDNVEDILKNFGEQKIYRLPVMNTSKRMVGIVTLGDIAKAAKNDHKLHELIGLAKVQISNAG